MCVREFVHTACSRERLFLCRRFTSSSSGVRAATMESCDNPLYRNKPSTRVHAAPGGSSSISLGEGGPPRGFPVARAGETAAATRDTLPSPVDTTPTPKPNNPECVGHHSGSVSCGACITEGELPASSTAKTSVRVHQPPGGRSTLQFG